MKAAVLTIGDEILLGQTQNTNTTWLSNELATMGANITIQMTIADQLKQITDTLAYIEEQVDIIIITGGLGPTLDDITKEAISTYTQLTLQQHPQILEHLIKWYAQRNISPNETLPMQASFPEGSTLLWNERGSAPGIWLQHNNTIIVALPGVPFEMKQIFSDEVKPRIISTYNLPPLQHHYLRIAGISESQLSEKIKDIEHQFPAYLKLAYLPELGSLLLRLTNSDHTTAAQNTTAIYRRLIIDRLGQLVVSYLPETIEQYIVDYLRENRITLGFAESCTGGYLGHLITNISGASSVYKGTINTYLESTKQEILGVNAKTLAAYTAVSEEVAIEMVKGAAELLQSDITLSVTGYLEPNNEQKTYAWIAIYYKQKITTKRIEFYYGRKENKQVLSNQALNSLRLCLLND